MAEKVDSKTVYEGRVFDIRVDTIREDDVEYKREIVVHHGSAVIVPVFDDGTVALVRQYRHPAGKYLLEVPAGTLNEGEDPEAGALREVEEEIGWHAGKIEKLSEFYVSPGFLTEKMFLFLATDFTETAQNVVFIGGPGTGKTHLATAIGVAGIARHGKRVRFYSTVDLVNALVGGDNHLGRSGDNHDGRW